MFQKSQESAWEFLQVIEMRVRGGLNELHFIYLVFSLFIWLHWILVAAQGIFDLSDSMW